MLIPNMIQFIPVTNPLELNDDLGQIYIDSFPLDERREWQELKELLTQRNFNFNKILDGGKLIGLITTWNLPDFVFIEHLAIHESFQAKGIGAKVLKQIIEVTQARIILEVEEPDSETAKRRIAFYERSGFSVCDNIYWQPPYSPGKNKVKMLLMSFPEPLNSKDFSKIKAQIYQHVYQFLE